MTLRPLPACFALALLVAPLAAFAQTNQGPIQRPHASATSAEQPGKPRSGKAKTHGRTHSREHQAVAPAPEDRSPPPRLGQ